MGQTDIADRCALGGLGRNVAGGRGSCPRNTRARGRPMFLDSVARARRKPHECTRNSVGIPYLGLWPVFLQNKPAAAVFQRSANIVRHFCWGFLFPKIEYIVQGVGQIQNNPWSCEHNSSNRTSLTRGVMLSQRRGTAVTWSPTCFGGKGRNPS